MAHSPFLRSEMILGENSTEKLKQKNVILFGLGGVGSYTAEALARSGIGKLTIVDSDVVSVTNINRQLCALHSTVGKPKVEVYDKFVAAYKDMNKKLQKEQRQRRLLTKQL